MVLKARGEGPRIAIVGPCASGKSTLAAQLQEMGVEARTPAQEHSDVPAMWQKLLDPQLLIALDAPNEVLRARRPGVGLTDALLRRQRSRLAHARDHADLELDTAELAVDAALEVILDLLERHDLWGTNAPD